MVKSALSLTIIGGVCGILLLATNQLTAPEINLNRELRARALMSEMLGAPLADNLDIQQGILGTCDSWLFQRIQSNGYAGPIDVLVLWRASSGGLVLRVTAHRETPGIGDFIDHARAPWITRFDGQTIARYDVLDNVSGATITTGAIRRAALSAQQQLEVHCAS